ncbi:MAG: pilus assembly PilX N-terminal domain-containing protein [Bacillota bacterium]|nr:pilus assembly PilX N-terminal domain-containing protein [Bacillota bacterium]
MRAILVSEKGSAMVVALLIFLIVSIMGTCMLGVARMENSIAVNAERAEQARHAADAGIYIGRDVVLSYLMAGKGLPVIDNIELGNKTVVSITMKTDKDNNGMLDGDGVIQINSKGKVLRADGTVVASTTAQAGVCVNALPYNTHLLLTTQKPIQSAGNFRSRDLMAEYFPESGVTIGVGPIVSYDYVN